MAMKTSRGYHLRKLQPLSLIFVTVVALCIFSPHAKAENDDDDSTAVNEYDELVEQTLTLNTVISAVETSDGSIIESPDYIQMQGESNIVHTIVFQYRGFISI